MLKVVEDEQSWQSADIVDHLMIRQISVEGQKAGGSELVHTFEEPGTYEVKLSVKDNHGGETFSVVQIRAGNAAPKVEIATDANRTFYWDNAPFDYKVRVTDTEDVDIDTERVNVSLNYLRNGKDLAVILTNPGAGDVRFAKGQYLLNTLIQIEPAGGFIEPGLGR